MELMVDVVLVGGLLLPGENVGLECYRKRKIGCSLVYSTAGSYCHIDWLDIVFDFVSVLKSWSSLLDFGIG